MGVFSDLGNSKEIDAFGHSLATQLLQRLPLDRFDNDKKRLAEVEIAIAHAQGFQRTSKLGTIGKSRLVNAFQWALIEKGVAPGVARAIGYEMANRIAKRKVEK